MNYYAYLKQKGEGCDYTIGCGNTLIRIEANSDKEAISKLSEIIEERYSDDPELSNVSLFRDKIDFDFRSLKEDIKAKKRKAKSDREHIKDLEDFERLKNKLGK